MKAECRGRGATSKKWAAKKCNLPAGNLWPGGPHAIPTGRCLLAVDPGDGPGHLQVQRAGPRWRHLLLLLPQGACTLGCPIATTPLWALQSFPHFCFSLGTLGTCPQWSISALFSCREQECSWGLVGQVLCSPSPTWSLQTKGACPKKREGNPPSQGPAPGGPEMLKAHTLASVFLISVFTNLAHTYTNAIFNLQK